MKRIAIIGGGISGLAAAFALEQARRAARRWSYTLFESSARLGGVIFTDRAEGCLIEAGPDSFLTEKPWAADSAAGGDGDQLIGSNDADRKTYILVKGKLVPMPDGLMFMVPTNILPTVLSSLFSTCYQVARWRGSGFIRRTAPTAMRAWRRWWSAITARRWWTVSPTRCSREFTAAKASQLSVRAVLPRFAEMEAKYGSLGRGMLAARKNVKRSLPAPSIFSSLKGGMQQLEEALVARLPAEALRANSPVQAVQRQDRGWVVSAGYASDQFDAVIVATPASAAAALLEIASAELASELRAISYSSSVTVALGFDQNVRVALPAGFWISGAAPRRQALAGCDFCS